MDPEISCDDKLPFEISSGNVFADIGFENAEEMIAKSNLILAIARTIKARGLTQSKASGIVCVDQPTLSKLLRGQTLSFTLDRLSNILTLLGQDVIISVAPHKGRAGEKGRMTVSIAGLS